MIGAMGYHVVRRARVGGAPEAGGPRGRPGSPGVRSDDARPALKQSRARLWRYPPGSRGRRHADKVQEEVFVVLAGTLTMHLGDPPERVELPPQSVVAVEPGTALQLRNDGDEEVVVLIWGAPPEQGGADFFEDATGEP